MHQIKCQSTLWLSLKNPTRPLLNEIVLRFTCYIWPLWLFMERAAVTTMIGRCPEIRIAVELQWLSKEPSTNHNPCITDRQSLNIYNAVHVGRIRRTVRYLMFYVGLHSPPYTVQPETFRDNFNVVEPLRAVAPLTYGVVQIDPADTGKLTGQTWSAPPTYVHINVQPPTRYPFPALRRATWLPRYRCIVHQN